MLSKNLRTKISSSSSLSTNYKDISFLSFYRLHRTRTQLEGLTWPCSTECRASSKENWGQNIGKGQWNTEIPSLYTLKKFCIRENYHDRTENTTRDLLISRNRSLLIKPNSRTKLQHAKVIMSPIAMQGFE